MSLISQTIGIIERYGVLEFYLPFVLTFSIFYALLQKSKIFGQNANTINAIVAVVAAFYVIAYTPVGFKMSEFLASFFTQTTIAIAGLIGIGLIIGIVYQTGILPGEEWKNMKYGRFAVTLALLLIGVIIFFTSGGPEVFGFKRVSVGGISSEDLFFLLLIGGTLGLIIGVPYFAGKKGT